MQSELAFVTKIRNKVIRTKNTITAATAAEEQE
jgi:hypothetical protein